MLNPEHSSGAYSGAVRGEAKTRRAAHWAWGATLALGVIFLDSERLISRRDIVVRADLADTPEAEVAQPASDVQADHDSQH